MKIDIHGCVFSLQLTWDFLLSWCRGVGRAVPSSLMRQFSQRTGVLRHAGVWAVRCEAGDISAQVGRPKPRVRQLIWGCLDHSVIGKLSCNITRAKNGGGGNGLILVIRHPVWIVMGIQHQTYFLWDMMDYLLLAVFNSNLSKTRATHISNKTAN